MSPPPRRPTSGRFKPTAPCRSKFDPSCSARLLVGEPAKELVIFRTCALEKENRGRSPDLQATVLGVGVRRGGKFACGPDR